MSKPSQKQRSRARAGQPARRKTFVIATEGSKTEPQYFNLFKKPYSKIQVKCLNSRHDSAPGQVLMRMKRHLLDNPLQPGDEAWLVVDKNNWSEQQLAPLVAWAKQDDNHHLVLSNPKFEYWLLLHFEDGKGVGSSQECDKRLRRRRPNYRKGIDASDFTPERIKQAVRRGRQRGRSSKDAWPRAPGNTTVWQLVENLLPALDPPA